MKTVKRYSPEVRDRAVRMVLEQQHEHRAQWAAIQSIAKNRIFTLTPNYLLVIMAP